MTTSRLTRRAFLQLTAGLSAGALMAACAPVGSGANEGGDGASAENVELSFAMYNFDPWLVALDDMYKVFMADNPGITVKVESTPGEDFWSRQEARLAAGNPSDMSIGDPGFFGRYAHKGYYLALEPYLERDSVDLAKWFPVTVNDCRYDKSTGIVGQGTLFGMPATYVGTVLYYNKDLFDAAGLAYPDDSWDRNNLFDAALALTRDSAGNQADSADFNPDDIAQWGITMINRDGISTTVWNNGGELINSDQTACMMTEPAAVEMFAWLASLLHEHHVHPTTAQLEGLPNPFQVSKVAMSVDGTWNLGYYGENLEFNWDIAPIAKGTAGLDRITYAGTNTLHIFKDSSHLDEAWKLMQLMTGPKGMEAFSKTGTPALQETANSDVYLSGPPEHRAVAVDIGAYARNYYPGLKSDQWKQIFNAELEALWINNVPAADVLQTICDKITPILQTPVDQL
ncbi:MAG: extracellular solute-binding protein [Caldilineaceae bacterium]